MVSISSRFWSMSMYWVWLLYIERKRNFQTFSM